MNGIVLAMKEWGSSWDGWPNLEYIKPYFDVWWLNASTDILLCTLVTTVEDGQ